MIPSPASLVDRLVETATPYALILNLPYVIAVTAVAAEVAWLARAGPSRRRVLGSAATAAAMAAGALVVAVPYAAALRFLWEALATLRWEGAARVWDDHPAVGALLAFVAWDLVGWLYHLIGHRTRIGWAAHQPHHTGPDFDATLGLRQSWAPIHALLLHPLLALAGFDLKVILVCAALSNCWQVLEHTSLTIRFPQWFSAVVMTPAAHRHHHRRDGAPVNLGPVLTVWDRLAGTWIPAHAPAPTAYGLGSTSTANPLKIEAAGWIRLVRSRRPTGANREPRQPPPAASTATPDSVSR